MSFQVLRPAVGANAPRWDGVGRGHYEVWYLTLSDPASRRGFWFRYTLEVPRDPGREAVAELWGFVFRPGGPAVGGKVTLPATFPPRGTMNVGDAVLHDGHATGTLPDVGLSWDLTWDPSDIALWHIPGWVGRSRLPSTRVVSPTVDAAFRGQVRVGDEVVVLDDARGCQTHLWGRQHAARWQWGHCNAFDAEAPVLVEAVSAVPLLTPGRAAPVGFTLLYVEVDGRPIPCNAFPWLLAATSTVDGHRWQITGRTRDHRVRVLLEADPAEMAQVTYEDPDGAQAFCANSEIARCRLEVEERGGGDQVFESDGLAHVEFGRRTPDPDVPVLC